MDELTTRLKNTSDECLKSYELWSQDKKKSDAREPLQDAVHELRKVAARLEIELAVSERDENGKPMPIPGHRSNSRGQQSKRKPLKKPHTPNNTKGNENGGGKENKPSKSSDDSSNELPSFISGKTDGAESKEAAPKKAPAKRASKPKTED